MIDSQLDKVGKCVFINFIVLCVGAIKEKSVLLFPYCTLERLQCAVFAQVCCICRISGKYSTLGNRQVTANIDY